jgi:mono/diheme cytochrome c family protein
MAKELPQAAAVRNVTAGWVGLWVLGSATLAAAADLDHGHEVFDRWCAPCHNAGNTYSGTIALQAKYQGKLPAALTDRTDLSPAAVDYFVRHGAGLMPPIRKTEVTDSELKDLVAYVTRNYRQ